MAKKLLATFMALIMLVAIAGCGTSSAPPASGSQASSQAAPQSASSSQAAPAAEEIPEITVFFTKGGFDVPPENDIIKKDIEEKSGVKFTQIAPPIANYNEQVAVMMASNDLPDIIKFNRYTDLFLYQSQGALAELDPLMDLMPNVTKNVPQAALDMCSIGGKLYSVPIWTSEKRFNNVIRGDFLDNLGLEVPVTLEEYENVYKEIRDKMPGSYGIGGVADYLELFEAVMGAYGIMGPARGYFKLENGELVPMATHPQMKECLEYLAYLYKEKMIDPEWMLNKTDEHLNEAAMKNKHFAVHKWWTWEPKIEVEMQKVDPKVHFDRVAPPVGPYGSGVRGVPIVNVPICIISTSDKKEASAKFIDWMNSDEGMMIQYSGVEGVHWEKKDGKYFTLPQFDEDAKWIQWYSLFEPEPVLLLVETYLVQSRRDSFKWDIVRNDADGLITDAQQKYMGDLNIFVQEVFTEIINGQRPVSDFDQFVKDFNARGGEEWTKEVNELAKERGRI